MPLLCGYGDAEVTVYAVTMDVIEELGNKRNGGWQSGVPWEKKHEAYILTYQSYVEGYLTAESYQSLYIVYVPMYESPVYVYTGRQYTQVTEILEEDDPVLEV